MEWVGLGKDGLASLDNSPFYDEAVKDGAPDLFDGGQV
jgi:hypothetical protein